MEEEVVMENPENNGKGKLVKKIIMAILIIAIIVAIILVVVNIVKPTPEKTVKKFIEYIDNGKFSEAYKLTDLKGMIIFSEYSNKDDYKDFKKDYRDFDDVFGDSWEDVEDDVKDSFDSYIDEIEDDMNDLEKFGVEIKTKKLKSKKVAKTDGTLYSVKVKAKVEIKEDEDSNTERETDDYVFYLMKSKGKYSIVGITGSGELTEFMMDY